MFDDITFQKISTLVWSATATFVLTFAARFISRKLHPQLKFGEVQEEEENIPFRQQSSLINDHLSSRFSSSKQAALISHQGKCMCGRVKFRVKAPSELHAILTDDFHPVTFPHIRILCDDFVWLADAEALYMVGDNSSSEHAGMHFLCAECSVEVLFSSTVDTTTLEVNLECIDTTHVTRIHHHHISTVPRTPEPQSFRQRLQFLQEQQQQQLLQQQHKQQQSVETFHPVDMTHLHTSSPSVSIASKTPKQLQASFSLWRDEQAIKTSTPTTTRSVKSIHSLDHVGTDEFYGDEAEDEGDEDVNPSHRNHQHFALNTQLNSLGHYSRNKHSQPEHHRRSGVSSHASNSSHGNHRQKYNGVFFPSNNHSPHNLHHTNSQHHNSRTYFAHRQHELEGSSAQDSDTTEETVFEQFFAPAAQFSPPPTATTSTHHNPAYHSDELQYILGADPATANTVWEILASQIPSVNHIAPRVTPNKTYRPISTSDNVHAHASHSMQPRGGTPTSLESASSHGSTHSHIHSGTSSPASSLGSNSASGGNNIRRFHNYHHAADDSHIQQYLSHHQHLTDHNGEVAPPKMSQRVHRKRGSRSLAYTASPMLVSEVLEQQQSSIVLPPLRDEYGNELDIHENGLWFACAMGEDFDGIPMSVPQQYQQHNRVSQPFPQTSPQYNYQYQASAVTNTSSVISPMEVSSLPTEHTSHSTHSDDMSSSTEPSTTQFGDLTSKEENDPVVEEDPPQRFPHVVDNQLLGEENDNSPSELWQRRHVTMRRSTPGRLHTSSSGSYYYQHSRTTTGCKQRSSAAATLGPSRVSMVDKHSAAAAGVPLDMAMYQNLKRYIGRHLSPSNKIYTGKDKSVNSSDKEALL